MYKASLFAMGQTRSSSVAYYADGRDKSSFYVPGKLTMKFSSMEQPSVATVL